MKCEYPLLCQNKPEIKVHFLNNTANPMKERKNFGKYITYLCFKNFYFRMFRAITLQIPVLLQKESINFISFTTFHTSMQGRKYLRHFSRQIQNKITQVDDVAISMLKWKMSDNWMPVLCRKKIYFALLCFLNYIYFNSTFILHLLLLPNTGLRKISIFWNYVWMCGLNDYA